jgi:hypothetical protein
MTRNGCSELALSGTDGKALRILAPSMLFSMQGPSFPSFEADGEALRTDRFALRFRSQGGFAACF